MICHEVWAYQVNYSVAKVVMADCIWWLIMRFNFAFRHPGICSHCFSMFWSIWIFEASWRVSARRHFLINSPLEYLPWASRMVNLEHLTLGLGTLQLGYSVLDANLKNSWNLKNQKKISSLAWISTKPESWFAPAFGRRCSHIYLSRIPNSNNR